MADVVRIVLSGGVYDGQGMVIPGEWFRSGHLRVPERAVEDIGFHDRDYRIRPISSTSRIYRRTGVVARDGRHVFELT